MLYVIAGCTLLLVVLTFLVLTTLTTGTYRLRQQLESIEALLKSIQTNTAQSQAFPRTIDENEMN